MLIAPGVDTQPQNRKDTQMQPTHHIRRGYSKANGLYAVSIGQNGNLPVLAWVDNPMHAQVWPEAEAIRIVSGVLGSRRHKGATKSIAAVPSPMHTGRNARG